MKKGIFFTVTLLSTLFSFAQQKHTINGTVKDEKTGETLIGATISLGKSGTVLSNNYGFYSITAAENNYTLIASFSGYRNDTFHISLTKDIVLNIDLPTQGSQLQEVVVVAKRSDNISGTLPVVQKVSID